ncbi:MlaD family protein [Hoyosella altamirensis]|uniref:Mce/MlaD domain-containing protein n=1 Tax=Hoyosella altamirensis TaxID=616997 RepID=A0A839RSW6_9ACTN|nr:MlaD family protein [Hoyosella altamirensis]MBB3039308.1 hypothetical protein [Hoyosella altamirensis]
MGESSKQKKFAALGLVGLLAAIAILTYAMFTGRFTATEPVTVFSSRSGLVMAPDAKVKLRGVDIGLVRAVSEVPGGAQLELDIYPAQLEKLPRTCGLRSARQPSSERSTCISSIPKTQTPRPSRRVPRSMPTPSQSN